jgi:ATP-dependent Clp protease protease subunit
VFVVQKNEKPKNDKLGECNLNTIVTEITEQGEVAIDVFQKLSNDRILFISGGIDDELASDICATLLLRDSESSEKKITMFINSHGGNIRDVLSIYDMMCIIETPIETVCIGAAMEEAAILLAAGAPGMRLATKHSVICAGQLINDSISMSDLTDAKSNLEQSQVDNKRMLEIIAKCTGNPIKKVVSDFERRVFMNSQEALKYGFIDQIVSSNK